MLKNCKRSRRSLLTTNGVIVFDRTVLIPADKRSAEKLKEIEGEDVRSVVPLDIYLGIDQLPFRVSEPLMEEICFFAIRSSSYQDAEDKIRRIYGLHISDDTMRKIVNWAGKIVFDADCRDAAEKMLTLENGDFKVPRDLDGVLYTHDRKDLPLWGAPAPPVKLPVKIWEPPLRRFLSLFFAN